MHQLTEQKLKYVFALDTHLDYATEMMNFVDVANDDPRMIDPNFFGLDHIDHGYRLHFICNHIKKKFKISFNSFSKRKKMKLSIFHSIAVITR